jgi:aminoglycoside phosphotransferase (APT) family kinase protein
MQADLRDVERMVRAVPAWRSGPLQLRPLETEIASQSFVVAVGGSQYVVRMPRSKTPLLGVTKANRAEASARAAKLGIGPPVFGVLPGAGTLITGYLGGWHLENGALVERLPEVVDVMRTFHSSGPLAESFPVHRVVEWHARDAAAQGVIAPSSYERLHQVSRRIERALEQSPAPSVPCHNDLTVGNVLFTADRAWLLDFEYAGMNDPFFDLGSLSANGELSMSVDERLLDLYFGTVTKPAMARLQLMKIMCLFRQGMWGVVQQALGAIEADFAGYAEERLARCERLAASAAFDGWLDQARQPLDGGI